MLMILSMQVPLQDPIGNEKRVEKIQQLRYLIYALLPVLKQINRQQSAELELEAKIKGRICDLFDFFYIMLLYLFPF